MFWGVEYGRLGILKYVFVVGGNFDVLGLLVCKVKGLVVSDMEIEDSDNDNIDGDDINDDDVDVVLVMCMLDFKFQFYVILFYFVVKNGYCDVVIWLFDNGVDINVFLFWVCFCYVMKFDRNFL